MSARLLPFNYRELPSGEVLISNLGGFHNLLENHGVLECLVKDPNIIDSDERTMLSRNLFLADEDQYEGSVKLLTSAYAYRQKQPITKPYLFMVIPTLRCDHDCTYCQVSRVKENKMGFDLSIDAIVPTINLIRRIGRSPYKIEFQGGEPLIRFDFIKEFVAQLDALSERQDYEIVIATSLSKLNDEVIEWAKNKPVYFSTSFDGPAEVHNHNRRHKKINSYDEVVRGIRLIQQELGQDRVATVTTVTSELLDYPEELVNEHVELNLNGMFVRPLSPFGFSSFGKAESYSVEEFFEFYSKLLTRIIEINDASPFVEHNALIHLGKIFKRNSVGYVDLQSPAGYLLGALVVNYDGNIFGSDEARMLYQTHGINELVLGNVITNNFNVTNSPGASIPLCDSFLTCNPGCDECVYQPYCGADVMYHLGTQGDFVGDKSLSRFCDTQQHMFDLLFSMYYGNQQARNVFQRWLSDRGCS